MATRRKTRPVTPASEERASVTASVRRSSGKIGSASATKARSSGDYEGARLLLSRYCQLIDRGQIKELVDLYHPDARFSVSFDSGLVHVGREAILAWYTNFFRSRPRVRYPRHKIFEPCLELTENTATACTYFDSDFVEGNDDVMVLAGRYDDRLEKLRGRWYFKERTITICYHYSPGRGQEGMPP